jgi:hypothetical protein
VVLFLAGLMLTVVRGARLIALAMMLVSATSVGYLIWVDGRWADGYAKLEIGDTVDHSILLMGSPSYETDGTRWVEPEFARSERDLIPDCVRELWYVSFLHPQRIALCFNSDGRLVHKYPYRSW